MATSRKKLGELLVSLRLISEDQLTRALAVQAKQHSPLGTILVQMGFLSEELLLNALAAQIGVWPWRIDENPADPVAVAKIPAKLCQKHQVLPVAIRGDLLLLAMVNPHDFEAIEATRKASGMRVEPVLADAQRLVKAIDGQQDDNKINESLDELVDQALKDFNVNAKAKDKTAAITEADTRPVVGLVNQIVTEAIRQRASDVHIEPRHDRVEIRYRIDGQLRLAREIPSSLLPMLTTRLKIMAEIDIVEFRIPQDGRISVSLDGREVDLRVSVLPNYHGQRIVLRILDKTLALKKLEEIGFIETNLELFRSLVSKPYGMFLVTGPTGSGKTTTLYAALQELRDITNNVMTCEDPVEYEIDGVNQSMVNEKVGLTFAKQLRAILRQDPDVILVGEIRDGETAETAIRAAMTGHMVLSTLHCNDAASAVPRLLDMGIDPYLLSTSLIGVMSQRLLRMLCPKCKAAQRLTSEESDLLSAYGVTAPASIYHAVGCPACGHSGYQGRTAVHEIMPIVPKVSRMIANRESVEAIRDVATAYGYSSMQHRALDLVVEGITSLEEAGRVVFLDAAYADNGGHQVLRVAA